MFVNCEKYPWTRIDMIKCQNPKDIQKVQTQKSNIWEAWKMTETVITVIDYQTETIFCQSVNQLIVSGVIPCKLHVKQT